MMSEYKMVVYVCVLLSLTSWGKEKQRELSSLYLIIFTNTFLNMVCKFVYIYIEIYNIAIAIAIDHIKIQLQT